MSLNYPQYPRLSRALVVCFLYNVMPLNNSLVRKPGGQAGSNGWSQYTGSFLYLKY